MQSPVEARSHLLRAELRRIVACLAREAWVRQVILFGSAANGPLHEWSDLDLVIIGNTAAPFIDRALALSHLVKPQVGTQFLVYTPEELRSVRDRPFIRDEILARGKVVPMNPHEDALRWLQFAREDLTVGRLAHGEGLYNQACFHAQQCTEKAVKALIARAGEPLPRTHALADLWPQMSEETQAELAEVRDAAVALDQFYIPTRYPDAAPGSLPEGPPQRRHAEGALATAQAVLETAQRLAGR